MIESLIEIEQCDLKKELMEEDLPDEFKYLEDDPDFVGLIDDEEHWHNLALLCMDTYFADKQLHCGGPIPPKLLFSEKNISLVRDVVRKNNEGFGKVIKSIFEVLHTYSPLRYDVVDIQKPWDVATLIKYMRSVHSYNIPKEFVPGITLLYIRFCKGYSISDEIMEQLT